MAKQHFKSAKTMRGVNMRLKEMLNFFSEMQTPNRQECIITDFEGVLKIIDRITEEWQCNFDVLEFICEAIREDIRSDYLTKYIYSDWSYNDEGEIVKNRNGITYEMMSLLPTICFTENKEEIKIEPETQIYEVDMKTDCVIAKFWNDKSIKYAVKDINKEGFKHIEKNLKSFYYPLLKICVITNGFHHSAVASVRREGKFTTNYSYDITKLFPHVSTNGCNWYNTHTGEKLLAVHDFRVAALYEIYKKQAEALSDGGKK